MLLEKLKEQDNFTNHEKEAAGYILDMQSCWINPDRRICFEQIIDCVLGSMNGYGLWIFMIEEKKC